MTTRLPIVASLALVLMSGCGAVLSSRDGSTTIEPVSVFPTGGLADALTGSGTASECPALTSRALDATLSEADRAAAVARRTELGC